MLGTHVNNIIKYGITAFRKSAKIMKYNKWVDVATWVAIAVITACIAVIAAAGCVIYNEQGISTEKRENAIKRAENAVIIDSLKN